MITLDTPLSKNTSIKPAMLARFKRLNMQTVGDLLRHLPSRYEDYSETLSIKDAAVNTSATFEGTVLSVSAKKTWKKKMLLTEAILQDDSGTITLIWFNQRHIAATIKEGSKLRVSGKIIASKNGFQISNPAFEFSERRSVHTGRLVPIYPETEGLSSKYLRWQIASALKQNISVSDPVPEEILERLHLPSLVRAFRFAHAPRSENESLLARKRFAFDEMLTVQLKTLRVKQQWETKRAISFANNAAEIESFVRKLPFPLTGAQQNATDTILADLSQSVPMNRLLNGDVGSGKTIVAALAALRVAQANCQVVLLAPTEILALQHFRSLQKLFENEAFETSLLTHGYQLLGQEKVSRQTLTQSIASGIARIIVGTHALLQKDIAFHKLCLAIVDEQHRFGVAQRAFLQQSAAAMNDGVDEAIPHFLTLTATPIPRTLALTVFGNLALSILDEMPKNRKPIKTHIAASNADRVAVYRFVKREIIKGRQAFVILPFVELSETLGEVKAAVAEHKRLSEEVFPDLKLGLLHGKLKSKEKESVMKDFKDRKLDILVATSVVEVGIDIPNATVLLIEDADRFGLSQLHQFRGRVGRGEHQSRCFLFPGENASASNERLRAMIECSSGFEIAERDLAIRGPGALLGTRQSGVPDIAMEHMGNARLIAIAHEEASRILRTDPLLIKHPLLAQTLKRFDERIHLE